MRFLYPKAVGFFQDDHSVYIDVKNIPGKRQSLLIDCGNNHTLSFKEFTRISTILISHTHIDHFIGFDNILRMNLRENKKITVIGPAPMSSILHHRLRGYIWNLIYDSPLEIEAWDISRKSIKKYLFKCREKFAKKYFLGKTNADNPIIDNEYYSCSHIILQHGIPTIGYSIKEKDRLKADKSKMLGLGLNGGQWMKKLKSKSFTENETVTIGEKTFLFKDLYEDIILEEKGFKISYITDTILNPNLLKKITAFIKGSDEFFCESTFMEKNKKLAVEYYHLTAKQAGELARLGDVKQLYLIHISFRYSDPYLVLDEAKKEYPKAKFPLFSAKCIVAKKK